MMFDVAVLGASGYAGGELVRLLDEHPNFRVAYLGAHTRAGQPLAEVHPQLAGGDRVLGGSQAADLPQVQAAFLALPHGSSWEVGQQLTEKGVAVFDLGSDYRMDTPHRYAEAYQDPHPLPTELSSWAYGLPELFRNDLLQATKVAVPGCYPTGALLALGPLWAAGVIDGPIVVDAISGVTGAGRSNRPDLTFGAVAEGVKAYAVGTHRHRPEIEMGLFLLSGKETPVQFTPHLAPMQRGLLSTCSATITEPVRPYHVLDDAYAYSPFVEVIDQPPQTRWVVNSNRALINVVEDEKTGRVIVTTAIDNLVKGAAGQAVQCANVAFELPEDAGLPVAGWLP